MKVRQGFVSNSSSSSFIITRKREDLSQEELNKINEIHFDPEWYEKDEIEDILNDYKGEEILIYTSVDYGDEEVAEKIIRTLAKKLNLDINIKVGDY